MLYNPLSPHDAIINAGLMNWFAPGIAGILGILFTAGGIFTIRIWLKRRKV